jgi:hypothetical protein
VLRSTVVLLAVLLLAVLLLAGASSLAAQSSSPSPTLPSDTLQANYAPKSSVAPSPELAPTLPSDTLKATSPQASFPSDSFNDGDGAEDAGPMTPGDSAALRDLQSWIESHPEMITPPPVRAVLVRV